MRGRANQDMEEACWPLTALEANDTHMTSGTFPWLELLLTVRFWEVEPSWEVMPSGNVDICRPPRSPHKMVKLSNLRESRMLRRVYLPRMSFQIVNHMMQITH